MCVSGSCPGRLPRGKRPLVLCPGARCQAHVTIPHNAGNRPVFSGLARPGRHAARGPGGRRVRPPTSR
ncbi:hypothetical protein L506_1121 [Bordetella bronchiseptica GA96-01]|nr:hypothetical protein L506_1121 [Bordetella bronchiseptica GA96-01]